MRFESRIRACLIAVAMTMAVWTGADQPLGGQALDLRAHDPALIQADGTFYLFSTGRGISVFRSRDMRSWERMPPVFPEPPAWTNETIPGSRGRFWAPDISVHEGTYYLFYSVSTFGSNRSAIGVATNTTLDPDDPAFGWMDHGPVVRSIPGRDRFNAIDPNLVTDGAGAPWLAFGSFWDGIKLTRLAEDRRSLSQPQEWYSVAGRHRYWKLPETEAGDTLSSAIEAPFIFKKGGYYYLFVSWDRCCAGPESTYKIMVGRSENLTGPYRDRADQDMRFGGGSLVAAGNEDWAGVGHNAVYTVDGVDYLVFHGYDLEDEGRTKLWIREVKWDEDGWPTVSLDGGTKP